MNNAAHHNNFDFLRFLFASLVIVTHAYALLGHIELDPFNRISGRVFSEIAVCGFFVISGFLIHQSLERSSTLVSFLRKRFVRIFPGLAAVLLLSVFVLGPVFSTLSPVAYFTDKDTWAYLFSNIFLLPLHKDLPGLFTHNFETAVNGSLWTLRYEVLFYLALCLFFKTPLNLKKKIFPVLFILLTTTHLLLKFGYVKTPAALSSHLFFFTSLGAYFSAGMTLSLFTGSLLAYKKMLFICAAGIFTVSSLFMQQELFVFGMISFPVMVITLGYLYMPFLHFSKHTGDISYGTYIYAFPVQQAIIVLIPTITTEGMMLPSLFFSWLLGMLSWHLVEKKFLAKRRTAGTPALI